MQDKINSDQTAVEKPNLWIIGDQFREKIEFEETEVHHCCIAGGTWFLRRFIESAIPSITSQVKTYHKNVFRRASQEPKATLKFKAYPSYPKVFAAVDKNGKRSSTPATVRVEEAHYFVPEPNDLDSIFEPLEGAIEENDFLIIEDMAMGFRSQRKLEWKSFLDSAATAFKTSKEPKIIVLLGRDCPDLSSDNLKTKPDDFWFKLWNDHKDHTMVVINADLLRFEGADISRRICWEKTAQDFVKELHSRPRLKGFTDFAHLVVRFGVTAAIHCFKIEGECGYVLHYDTKSKDGTFRNVQDEGAIIGNNSMFVASLIKSLFVNKKDASTSTRMVQEAIEEALPACQRLFRHGYPAPKSSSTNEQSWLDNWPPNEIFDENVYKSNLGKKLPEAAMPSMANLIARAPIPFSGENWSIVAESVPGAEMAKLAQRIVFYGLGRALNNPESNKNFGIEAFAPIAGFGKLETLDRAEVESFRGVQKIMRRYLQLVANVNSELKDKKKSEDGLLLAPMSIAVFGPPGSGKSFGVKEIAKSIRVELELDFVEINLSQISSPELLVNDLSNKVYYRKSIYNPATGMPQMEDKLEKIPFIFFDEFDCQTDTHLGWLKTFLGPMSDGKLSGHTFSMDMSRSIFAFAGGTKQTYIDFARASTSVSDQDRLSFETAKGPDFVSRLRGHINIKGINRANPSDDVYVLRRAIMLRSYLEKNRLVGSDGVARIDGSVVYSMLKTASYKHGARSMDALIAMCVPIANRIEKASLPLAALMNMHVDSVDIHSLIEDYQPYRTDPPRAFNYHTS